LVLTQPVLDPFSIESCFRRIARRAVLETQRLWAIGI
jgi:hypothetical protein